MIINTCKICKLEFVKPHNPKRVFIYCSCKCMWLDKEKTKKHWDKMKWRTAWNKWIKWKQDWHNTSWFTPWWNKWMTWIYTEEVLEKNRIAHLWKEPWNKWTKASEETRKKQSEKKKWKYWELSWWWKWWLTSKNKLERDRFEYHLWRKSVFERDNFTCQKYWIQWWKLEAHHINNFSEYPELRTSIENWITLSKQAHKEFHKKYWKKNNTKKQIEEFIESV